MRSAAVMERLRHWFMVGCAIVAISHLISSAHARYDGPPGPFSGWFAGAMTPNDCLICCTVADGHVVLARPDPTSPEGWAVFWQDQWQPVPAHTRAAICEPNGPEAEDRRSMQSHRVGDYPIHPEGHAVIWFYEGKIRCFTPPGAGT